MPIFMYALTIFSSPLPSGCCLPVLPEEDYTFLIPFGFELRQIMVRLSSFILESLDCFISG